MVVYRRFKTSPRTDRRELLSVEQFLLRHPKQAYGLRDFLMQQPEIRDMELLRRLDFAAHVADNFIGQIGCKMCGQPETQVSLYRGYQGSLSSSPDFVYCSRDCFDVDPALTTETGKLERVPFGLRIATLANTRYDEESLVRLVKQGMGEGTALPKRATAEQLEEYFNHWDLRREYVMPEQLRDREDYPAAIGQRSMF